MSKGLSTPRSTLNAEPTAGFSTKTPNASFYTCAALLLCSKDASFYENTSTLNNRHDYVE
ncbi:hypothetical protein AJ78_00174 [Emergomyces pasteurianus Ep9510]|uniref:Uncharacterized protein n=1 Tax=Emergomyces pasteurianus Ep9510 TaxID=1447872 RepID=A0A1J9PVQ6_9EURO|nr:hypothetical protein AJ78_00174 [Emergomyces pasteurianus Ep9510]